MRSYRYFWSLLLIVVGVLLLLGNLGLLPADIWPLIWPSILILLGVWILSRRLLGQGFRRTELIAIPLEGALDARIVVSHGAGRVTIGGVADPGQLLSGSFGGGAEHTLNRSGTRLDLDLRAEVGRGFEYAFPWMWGPGSALDWRFSLSGEVSLSLDVRTGASELFLDLSQLRLTELRLETGASSCDITLPARAGLTRVSVKGGATIVRLHVPDGVAARIIDRGGLADYNVNTARFPRTENGYQSSDFDTAENKVEIDAEVGLSSVSIL
ncbi:MAG TPA: DUF5668 domain-containing protein [Anaerolineales bacterium]|nr:DUF5668 domain-containing protein [Anaerolineales bacterium]